MLPPGEKPLSDPNAGGPVVSPEDRPAAAAPAPRGKRPWLVRLLPLLIVIVALGGFGGIVGYYYFASSSGSVDGVAPLVRADQRPVRVRPENPGGMDVPHQDKEIYDKVAGRRGGTPPAAERLLPPPETPLPRPAPSAGAAPPNAPAILGNTGPVAPGTLAATPPRPPSAPPPAEANVPPPPDVAPPPPSAVTSQTTIPPPAPGNSALPGTARTAPPAATPRPAPPPAVAAATAPRVVGGSRVVLASLQTEADARREWERLRRQYGDALNAMAADFVRTDLGERGVYWRIYVGPVESAPDAQARCAALKQRQVNCFVARP